MIAASAYSSCTVEGTVTLDERGGPGLRDELSREYDGRPAGIEPPEVVRVVCRLTPNKVISR